jgi:phosphoribosylaminoimidazole (AIR) synthetase
VAKNEKAQEARNEGAQAAKDGESITALADVNGGSLEEKVNRMSPAEEQARQAEEQYPHLGVTFAGQHEEGPEEARQGYAATSRATVGRVVVVHEDTVHEGELYKAGTQDLPLEVADALIADGKAYEPAGKKKGR